VDIGGEGTRSYRVDAYRFRCDFARQSDREGLHRAFARCIAHAAVEAAQHRRHQLRAAASGVIAATFGTTRAFISGGAEHQAPPGGCLAGVIRRLAGTSRR
jgi:hypothetical protein